jgi:uncharacterized protein YndB with AHSA1/START domain
VSARSTAHGTFVIERRFAAPPRRVFTAWSDPDKKQRWFGCHDDWVTLDSLRSASRPGPLRGRALRAPEKSRRFAAEYRLDLRAGGAELSRSRAPDGAMHVYEARFIDVVPGERIVYAYDMRADDTRASVSLVTVELAPDGAGTKMTFTEQVVFLDGHGDLAERREGTELGLLRIDGVLA